MYSVLLVCTANICRSPMAMGLLRGRVQAESAAWRIESAGVWAQTGLPAAEYTRLVLQARGIDLADHHSRRVTRDLIRQFHLVLTMEAGQKTALQAAFPECAGRIYLITELAGENWDIADPVSCPLEDYEDTARELEGILDCHLERIRHLARA